MKAIDEADEKKRKKMMPVSARSGSFISAPPSTAWCIPHLGVSCADRNRSRTGAIIHNSNCSNSSKHNSSSSTTLLPHRCSRLRSCHHSSFLPVTFPAATAERWGTLLRSVASPHKATHCDLWHPWSINRGANRRVPCYGLAAPTIPPWRKFPCEKKC
jgi:hypothetical protein